MKIITADERLSEHRGAKILIVGPTGVGKTSLLRTLSSTATLFIDVEAGDLAVQDWPGDTIRVDDWATARDLACRVGGPNSSFPPTAAYSEAHYRDIGGALENLDRYTTIFVDSITAISRLSFRWAEQQPEAFSDRSGKKDTRGAYGLHALENLDRYTTIFVNSITAISRLSFRWTEQQPEAFSDRSGKKDTRGAYGLHAREMLNWLQQLQHARGKNVVFVGILEKVIDEFNRATGWQLQMEGGKTGRELPGIVDQIITYQFLDFGDGVPTRSFVCTTPNTWGYPAKDRAGRLDQIEEPHLGRLIGKLTERKTSSPEQKLNPAAE